jgi:DNA-binding transcriptional ArsR family regulator
VLVGPRTAWCKASAISDVSRCDPDGVSGREIASVAKVIGNSTCADVLDALLSDRSLTVSAIAGEIGMARSTVSEAVGTLASAGLVHRSRHGRVTVVRLAGHEVADALEALGRLARSPTPIGLRAVSRMNALRRARTCYDHLAGELGVRLADSLVSAEVISADPDGTWQLTDDGRRRLIELGIAPALIAQTGRRPLVRACTDWTEHRPHVAGRVGAAICASWLQLGVVRRLPGSRAVQITEAAEDWLRGLAYTRGGECQAG